MNAQLSDPIPKIVASEAGEMVAQLAKLFGLPPSSLLPVCLYLAGVALGNAATVITHIFPGALNLALGCLVCEDGQGPLSMAIGTTLGSEIDQKVQKL